MAIGSITGSSGSSDPTSPVRARRCWRRRSARSSPRGAGAPTSSIASASEGDGKTVPTSSQLWTALLDWGSQTRRRLSAQLRSCFIAVQAQRLHHRCVAEAEQEGWAVAVVDVLAESPGRYREYVLVFPGEPLVAHDREAGTLDH